MQRIYLNKANINKSDIKVVEKGFSWGCNLWKIYNKI